MNIDRFRAAWTGLTLANRVNRILILLLIGANIALAITLNQTERTVVLVPPVLEGEITVARSSASREVKASGPVAKPVNAVRTCALGIEFKNYRPVVVYLDVYPGGAAPGPNPGEAP